YTDNYITIGLTALHPFSRGSSHISSADTSAKPTINTNSYQNPLDLEVFAGHMMFIEELAQTPPLRDLIKDPDSGRRNLPKAHAKTLEEARAYAKTSSISNWKPVGTCAMLPREKGGVVGADLLVHGVKGFRIVGSSIMPIITRGHPQVTGYAVAERAADIILGRA
ncbi:glucose-methanol-choline oxidoreductase, partial [Byssothecium circinans]